MDARWMSMEANADKEDTREQIGREIRKGTIRVVPAPGGGIRIIPQPLGPSRRREDPGPAKRPAADGRTPVKP